MTGIGGCWASDDPRPFYAGIDNGTSGAVAVLGPNGQPVALHKTPTMELGTKGKFIDDLKLRDILLPPGRKPSSIVVVFEWAQKQPLFGTKTNWAQGFHGGTVLTTLRQNGIKCYGADPKEWQKEMLAKFRHLPDTKEMSKAATKEMFPDVNLIPAGGRKEFDGFADALLMAAWGRKHAL